MTSKEILAFISEVGIVPIVRTSSAEGAIRAVEAIYAGGVRAAEITMTVPGAIHALEKLADRFGGKLILGAGTVLDPETARACMLAGTEFFVTPSRRSDAHRSAHGVGSRRRRGQDLSLRQRGRRVGGCQVREGRPLRHHREPRPPVPGGHRQSAVGNARMKAC
jgi:hypothetical protein